MLKNIFANLIQNLYLDWADDPGFFRAREILGDIPNRPVGEFAEEMFESN